MAADWYKFLSDFLSLLHMSYCTQTQKTRCIHRQLLSIEKNEMNYFHIIRKLQGHIRYRMFLCLTFLWSIMSSIFSSTPFYDLQSLIHRYLLHHQNRPLFSLAWLVRSNYSYLMSNDRRTWRLNNNTDTICCALYHGFCLPHPWPISFLFFINVYSL